jgi:predicted amidohydrolase YtcJ
LLTLVAGLLLALLVAPGAAAAKKQPADLVIKNAKVYTVDADWSTAQAVAVREGRVVFVGSDQTATRYIGPGTQVVNARGNMVLPSFSDAHAHVGMTVRGLFAVSLWYLPTVDDYLAAVAEFAAANPDLEWIRGEGWSNTVAPDIGPLATDLDGVVSDRPVAITSEDYHSLWVNSKTLEIAGIDGFTPDPTGGKIERLPGTIGLPGSPEGIPSGTLREAAATMVQEIIPDYTVEQYKQGILAFQAYVAGPFGITLAFDPFLEPGSPGAQAYEELAQEGLLTMRVRGALTLDPDEDLATKLAAFEAERAVHTTPYFQTTAVKFFADGVIEGHTGYLDEPYADAAEYTEGADPDYRSEPLWETTALADAFTATDEAGFQIHVHSIGDAATSYTLDALECAYAENDPYDWRPGITHLQLVNTEDFQRFADMGVVAVPQPYWHMKDDYYTYLQVPYLGFPRADEEYPMKSFFDAGVHVASASDFPVTPEPNALVVIQLGVMRWFPGSFAVWEYPPPPSLEGVLWPEQRVMVEQMIRSYTVEGAYASFLEDETGSIEVGKSADIVIVNRDITTCDPEKIGKSKVLLTLFEGEEVFGTDGF